MNEKIDKEKSLTNYKLAKQNLNDNNRKENNHYIKSDFIFKLILSFLLALFCFIVFNSNTKISKNLQNSIRQIMEREFQFATISNWYSNRFGDPLSFININIDTNYPDNNAIYASGVVLEDFETNGNGILIKNNLNEKVRVIDDGVIIFVGNKDDFGNTVIVQHANGKESWYGKLDHSIVRIYENVKKGDTVGNVSNNENNVQGIYYFAIKQNNKFIDPTKVISFE